MKKRKKKEKKLFEPKGERISGRRFYHRTDMAGKNRHFSVRKGDGVGGL